MQRLAPPSLAPCRRHRCARTETTWHECSQLRNQVPIVGSGIRALAFKNFARIVDEHRVQLFVGDPALFQRRDDVVVDV